MNRIQKAIVVFTVVFVAAVLSGHALVESDANQALAYLDERGIVYGDGRTFHGDEPITVEQVSAMLCRADGFGGDTKWSVARNEYIQYAKSAGWITEDEFEHPTNTICGRELCSILFQYLPEDIKYCVDEGREVWIVKQLGLIEPSIQSKESITRMEFAESLYALLTLEVGSVSLCEANILPIYYTEMESRAYVQSWLDDIPYQIRQRFLTDGWELYIGDGFLKDGFYEIYGEASGLTREQDKIMVVTRDGQYSSILHEFGHFLHITNGYDPEFDAIYQRESGASGFSKHHRSSWREYYAQSFSYYVSGMKANFTACPETYVYFDNLRKSGWIT